MFRFIPVVTLVILVASCTRIDFRSEELQPVQYNSIDGDLEILVLTESTFVSREASGSVHSREYVFPPRILVHLSADVAYKDREIIITSVSVHDESGVNYLTLEPSNLVLRDSWYKDIEKYETYSHLKNMGGLGTVRDILITPWIGGIKKNKDYIFRLDYINFEGIEKQIEIGYKAKLNTEKGLVPSKLYWSSI